MTITRLNPAEPAAQILLAGLSTHLADLYGYQVDLARSTQAMQQPNVHFLGVRQDGELVGCGAVKLIKDAGAEAYGEIKALFVAEAQRGRGHSRAIMQALEAQLRSVDIQLARLATGTRQPEAVALYVSLGYTPCAPFGGQQADDLTVFMQKSLGDA